MLSKLAETAKRLTPLLLIELLVPGGTLVVLTVLLSGGSLPAIGQSRGRKA